MRVHTYEINFLTNSSRNEPRTDNSVGIYIRVVGTGNYTVRRGYMTCAVSCKMEIRRIVEKKSKILFRVKCV